MIIETPTINILTAKLPYKLANQIYNEYQARFKEAIYLIDNNKTFYILAEYKKTVELLLSLSIFHKRVITNLDGALKFYGTVTKENKTKIISIGSYNLDNDEKDNILAVIINYNQLLKKFAIDNSVMEYNETRELLQKIIILKSEFKED